MPISMNVSANYVTQSSLWSSARVLGPLTDKRITHYIKQGRYGEVPKEAPKLKRKKTAEHKSMRQKILETLLA